MIFKGHIILENGFGKLPIDKHEENLKEKAANFKKGRRWQDPICMSILLEVWVISLDHSGGSYDDVKPIKNT